MAFAALLAIASPLSAQAPADGGRWHRVNSDNAFVRSDASATVAYPVGRVPRDTLVLVVEDRFGWARVRPRGDAFGSLHAFVAAEHATVTGGDRVVVDVRTPLKAANFAAREDPARSWKEIARLEPGATLEFVETVAAEGRSFHKVRLPESAEAWINLSFLAPATAQEIAAMQASLAAASASPAESPEPTVVAGGLELVAPRSPAPAAVSASRAAIETVPRGADEREVEAVGIEVLVAEPAAASPRQPTLDDLESAWKAFQARGDAERQLGDFTELRDRYLVLASSTSSAAARHRATLRAEQILLQTEIQSRLLELRRMQERNLMDLQAIRDIRELMESRGDFDAVGRLNASLVYDGSRLPLLFRLQEPGEGATVAYLVPTRDFALAELTGQLVGVSGDLRYDEALRLNLITPRRVEILMETSR